MPFLNHLVDAPLANILIVGGLLFVGIGAVGKITGNIEPDKIGRVMSGLLGILLLVVGVLVHLQNDSSNPSTPNPATPSVQPIIHVFSATPPQVTKGGNVTIRWEVVHADDVELDPFGRVDATGSTVHQPQQTTIYKLNASNRGGGKNGAFLQVIVNEPKQPAPIPKPVIESFSVSPRTVTKGDKVMIMWKVLNADHVELEPFGKVSAAGSTSDQPQQTTSYKISATNKAGKDESLQEVMVAAPTDAHTHPDISGAWKSVEYGFVLNITQNGDSLSLTGGTSGPASGHFTGANTLRMRWPNGTYTGTLNPSRNTITWNNSTTWIR